MTFASYLGRMLERAYPERTVEVVNLGIVALSSLQVKLLVEDVTRRYQPDLVVVYSGNNEFLDVHAEKYAAAHATWVSPLKDALIDTNTYRFVNRALRGEPRPPSLAEQDFSSSDLRLTQDAIIQDVKMTRAEPTAAEPHTKLYGRSYASEQRPDGFPISQLDDSRRTVLAGDSAGADLGVAILLSLSDSGEAHSARGAQA